MQNNIREDGRIAINIGQGSPVSNIKKENFMCEICDNEGCINCNPNPDNLCDNCLGEGCPKCEPEKHPKQK